VTRPPTEPRKRPRQARSRVLFDALIEATRRLLGSDGLEAVTTARVAELAGVSIGSLYQYFPSREALIAAVIDRSLEADMAVLVPIIEELRNAPFDEALRGLIDMIVQRYRDETPLYREMVAALAAVDREAHVRRALEGYDHVVVYVLEPHRARLVANFEQRVWIMRTALISCVREAAAVLPEALERPEFAAQLEAMCRALLV
jgi:AcrR family transcriptional regulator